MCAVKVRLYYSVCILYCKHVPLKKDYYVKGMITVLPYDLETSLASFEIKT